MSITVTAAEPENVPPIANDDFLSTDVDTPLTITAADLLGNDVDPDGDSSMLSGEIVDVPTNGTLDVMTGVYTPKSGYEGTDSFTYRVFDGADYSDVATVTITVGHPPAGNTAPVPGFDSFATPVGAPLVINPNTLLANDYDADDDTLTVSLAGQPSHGTASIDAAGNIVYTPTAGYLGLDQFGYLANDGTDDSDYAAIITVNVGGPANTAAQASPDNLDTAIDTLLTITPDDLVDNDVDPDAGPDPLTPYVVSDPAHGTLDYNDDGTFTYTPDPGYEGTDTFRYTAFDGQADSTPTLVTITIAGQPTDSTVPVAGWDSLATAAGTSLTFSDDDLLANDYDAEGDPLSVVIVETTTDGMLTLNPNGTHTYTPPAGFTGTDTFTYVATDADGESVEAQVSINVGVPANTPAVATDDTLAAIANTPLTITFADLVGNDDDADGDDLGPFIVSYPHHGVLVDGPQNETLTYTPDPGYVGTDTFIYTAYDGQADSHPVTVTITVAAQM